MNVIYSDSSYDIVLVERSRIIRVLNAISMHKMLHSLHIYIFGIIIEINFFVYVYHNILYPYIKYNIYFLM